MKTSLYAVEITTADGPIVSRYFTTIRAARNWKRWCERKWIARIMEGGPGGVEVK